MSLSDKSHSHSSLALFHTKYQISCWNFKLWCEQADKIWIERGEDQWKWQQKWMTYYDYDSQVAHNDKVMGVKIKDNPDGFPHEFLKMKNFEGLHLTRLFINLSRWKKNSFFRWELTFEYYWKRERGGEISSLTTVSSSASEQFLNWLIFHWW